MKKILTICLLLAATFTVKAQQKPTKEETIALINRTTALSIGKHYLSSGIVVTESKLTYDSYSFTTKLDEGTIITNTYSDISWTTLSLEKMTVDILYGDLAEVRVRFEKDIKKERAYTGRETEIDNGPFLYIVIPTKEIESIKKAFLRLAEISFDETVNYINDIFKENKLSYYIGESNTGRMVKGITADKTGKVIIYDLYKGESVNENFDVILTSINLFDLLIYYSESFRAEGDDNKTCALLLRGNIDSNGNRSTVGFFAGATAPLAAPLAERLKKALKHLRSLCNRQADPFGN